ncbi:hypothetical protein CEP54_008311 [Fusarium duplospermum]|uniref:EKC/KEOPS complex subunit BUD32 n=1 Tax=Fusarium duplospermum TaxID=1325734 RepID=A0A428PWL2_9HYPO|nr:hypothetical protein CEP54_008311 [Fusarium duplospermum]
MSTLQESVVQVPYHIRHTETVGAGLSSWVHRLDAVVKCYMSDRGDERKREIAVYERLASDAIWHNGIMRYYGVLDEKSVVLQFAPNGSIRQYLGRGLHVPLSTKLRWAEQATDAIAFLHSKGIFHCDISCNNIFLDQDLNAMVGDFAGSALDQEQCLSWYETSHSHPDTEDPSAKSEAFALGSAFYEILVEKRPFEGTDECTIEKEIRCGRFPDLEQLPALKDAITKCWNQQYDSIDELLQDVKQGETSAWTMVY